MLIPLLQKSRAVPSWERAAFLRYTSGASLVRIAGAGRKDGVYRFSDGARLDDVNKLTNMPVASDPDRRAEGGRLLKNGDVVVLNRSGGYNMPKVQGKMVIAERIALGIPLDPDTMSVDEWEALPGIGPALARAIVLDRQKNGDFCSLEGVLRVPGVGRGKLHAVQQYFPDN